FARTIVEKALDTEQGISGRDYLEKIIQVGFDIPAIEHNRIEKILLPQLDLIINSIDLKHWDQNRWGNLYHSGLGKLFKSIRDVKRFLNSLTFNIKLIADEVNPIDFIGLEALRVFYPEIYKSIATNKELFIDPMMRSNNPNKLEEKRKLLDSIFLSKGTHEELAKNICLELFPQLRSIYPGTLFGSWSGDYKSWRKDRRICSEDIFDIYFVMGVPIAEVSQMELREVISLSTEPDKLTNLFRKYLKEEKIGRLLDFLNDILGDLTNDGIFGLCSSLIEIGDQLVDVRHGVFEMGADFQLHWLIFHALNKIENQISRFNWFLEQISQSNSLYTVVQQVAWNLPSKEDPRFNSNFDEKQLELLKEASVQKIEVYAQNGSLLKTRNFAEILRLWNEWAIDKDNFARFVDKTISSPESAIDFVEGFVFEGFSHTFGDYASRKELRFNFSSMSSLADVNKLRE
ncbi:MAG TPA: P-loop NTPase fold protein, partial [Flavobacterium sp.]|uniref:P-loop NTPase fold protein n=1 Tax=Flavobacterium sp. TaxID=239 RepID=UPI002F3F14CF